MAYRQGEFRRVQVKYRSVDRSGKVDIKFSTCWADGNGIHTVPIDKNQVDLYCVCCPDTDECYYLKPQDFGSTATLGVETPKNGQARRINLAADFRRAP